MALGATRDKLSTIRKRDVTRSFDVAHSEDNIAFGGANCRRSSSLGKNAYPWSTLATGRDNVIVAGDEHSG